MFRTILVPLDGSPTAEHALPLAVSLARRADAALRLVHVSQPKNDSAQPTSSSPQQDYLDVMAWPIRQEQHLAVYTSVLRGPVAETLANYSRSVNGSLIVMTTHGRGPISRFWLGSVTDSLVRQLPAPLLVIRAPEGTREVRPRRSDWKPQRILVPLDGSLLAERVLCPAVEIAKLTSAELVLVRIVDPAPLLAPEGLGPQAVMLDANVIDNAKTEASECLKQKADKLRREGLKVSCHVLVDSLVAPAIVDAGRESDLIALATHGRQGVSRMLLGSVADKVVRGATGPVLVVRPDIYH